MTPPDDRPWRLLKPAFDVPARPATGLWMLAASRLDGPALLAIRATGDWFYSDTSECGPDGDASSLLFRERTLCPSANVGALIGKLGGSSAESAEARTFPIGSFTVRRIEKAETGPLFLTMNDEPSGMTNNQGWVSVELWTLPAPAPEPEVVAASGEAPKA